MRNCAEVALNPEALARYGLPDIAYPVAGVALLSALAEDGEPPLGIMLCCAQKLARHGRTDWKHFAPAMGRLAELLAPDDWRDVVSAVGDLGWVEIGPVNIDGE
jgi:hypothetical protein